MYPPAITAVEIAESITVAADAVAHEILLDGCSPFVVAPHSYRLGAVAGDRAELAAALGRQPTAEECARLEAAVPDAIEARLVRLDEARYDARTPGDDAKGGE